MKTIVLIFMVFCSLSYAKSKLEKDLGYAAKTGAVYPVHYFQNVNANIKNEDGQTPLMIAPNNRYDNFIDALAIDQALVNVHEEDYAGKTAFDCIAPPLHVNRICITTGFMVPYVFLK